MKEDEWVKRMDRGAITILVVEDEENIRFSLVSGLRREGYQVFEAASGQEALELAQCHDPDVVLLDLMLPDMPGLDVSRQLRRSSQATIIMVTARDGESDVIAGLEMGADDYVTKPFSFSVLLARIRANLRRYENVEVAHGEVVQVGSVRLDPASYEASFDGKSLSLTPRLFQLLLFLARRVGRVCTRDELLNAVWGYDYSGETRTVDVHVHWLREKLHAGAPDLVLETVRGVGYRLVVSEEWN